MCKKVLSMMVAMVLLLMLFLPTGAVATQVQTDEFIIYEHQIKDADIRIEGDDLITLTTVIPTNTVPGARMMSDTSEPLKTATVSTVALVVNDPADTNEVYNELLSVAHENSSYKTNGDYVAGLRIHTTVYYTTQTVDGNEWYRLVRVIGGNDKSNVNSNIIGSGFVISNQHVQYGVWGPNLENLSPALHSWFSYEEPDNSASSFDINVENLHSNWPTVNEYQSILGATYTVTIHCVRDNTDRTLELVNNPLNSVTFPTPEQLGGRREFVCTMG